MLSFPVTRNLKPSSFKNSPCKSLLGFKGQIGADTFEKTHKTPKLQKGQLSDDNNEMFTRPDTVMFRHDLHWTKFASYLSNRFLSEDKVNTIVYGCSSGEEAYTLSILLQDRCSNPERFFPIFAKDIDSKIIERNIQNQKSDRIMKDSYHPARKVLNLGKEEIKEYIMLEEKAPAKEVEKLTERVTKPVIFSPANILEDVKNIDSTAPSLVMMRNMWPYIDPKEYEDFAIKLYDKLKKGSVIVIGGYDYFGENGREDSNKFPKALIDAGFEPADFTKYINYNIVFEKN